VFGGFGLVMAVVVFFRIHDTPQPPPVNGTDQTAARGPSVIEVLRHVFSKPTVLLLSLAFAGMVFVDNGYKTWMPSFLEEDHGLTPFWASFWSMAAHYLGAIIGVTVGGRL
jgi:sugar phosphate permease